MKNFKTSLMAILAITFTSFMLTGCKPDASPKYDITMEITSASGTTVLYANEPSNPEDPLSYTLTLFDSNGVPVNNSEGTLTYEAPAYYLTYKNFNLTFHMRVWLFYNIGTPAESCTSLKINGNSYND